MPSAGDTSHILFFFKFAHLTLGKEVMCSTPPAGVGLKFMIRCFRIFTIHVTPVKVEQRILEVADKYQRVFYAVSIIDSPDEQTDNSSNKLGGWKPGGEERMYYW